MAQKLAAHYHNLPSEYCVLLTIIRRCHAHGSDSGRALVCMRAHLPLRARVVSPFQLKLPAILMADHIFPQATRPLNVKYRSVI